MALPDHELLRRIGKGSYGEVWIARTTIGTYRAVKIVHRSSFSDQRPFEREWSGIRKFEPISRSHEGFVDILQVGINDKAGYFYYVMELGDDEKRGQNIDPGHYSPRTLAKAIAAEGRLSVRDALDLGLALSLALAELHKHGLVHRDIKPSNIIFVNGIPKLADIGLVAGLDEARSYVGTEGFIPPEGPGTPQADVYGLGKVLYEACSGKDRHDYPALPTLLDKFPDHELFLELNEVLIKACHTDIGKRYASAWEMHADLLVLANGKSVRRLRMFERRWLRLKRTAATSAVAVLVMAAIGYGVYRDRKVASELHLKQVASDLEAASRALDSGDYLGSLSYFAETLRLDKGSAMLEREDRLRFGSTHAQCAKIEQMWFLRGVVGCVDFTSDGRRVLAIERDGKARVYDVETGNAASPAFGQKDTLWRGVFSPDGKLAVTASEDKTACIWRVADAVKVQTLTHSNTVLCASFSPDGTRLLTGCNDNIARIWSVRTGELLMELRGHAGNIRHGAFSPDGKQVIIWRTPLEI